MKKALKKLATIACTIAMLASSIPVFAAGYQSVLDTNITYETNFYTTVNEYGEYEETTKISNLISNFSNGYAIVYENVEIYDTEFMHLVFSESQYIINEKGERVSVPAFDSASSNTMISSDTAYDPTFGYGLDNFGGTTISIDSTDEDGYSISLYGYVGIADDVVIPCIYEDVVLRCNENVFRIGTYGDYTYIDKNGNEVAKPEVSVIDEVYKDSFETGVYTVEGRDGFYLAETNRKYGIINRNKEIVVPIEYDYICGLQSGYCWVAKNGKWSLYKLSKDSISVTVNNTPITFDQNPLIINGRTLAPVRAIFEALGATVEWKNDTREVISTKGDVTITMAIDSTTMYKNGTPITLDVAPQIVGGRTLVPVRAIAEAFNCTVEWSNDTQTVIITEQ